MRRASSEHAAAGSGDGDDAGAPVSGPRQRSEVRRSTRLRAAGAMTAAGASHNATTSTAATDAHEFELRTLTGAIADAQSAAAAASAAASHVPIDAGAAMADASTRITTRDSRHADHVFRSSVGPRSPVLPTSAPMVPVPTSPISTSAACRPSYSNRDALSAVKSPPAPMATPPKLFGATGTGRSAAATATGVDDETQLHNPSARAGRLPHYKHWASAATYSSSDDDDGDGDDDNVPRTMDAALSGYSQFDKPPVADAAARDRPVWLRGDSTVEEKKCDGASDAVAATEARDAVSSMRDPSLLSTSGAAWSGPGSSAPAGAGAVGKRPARRGRRAQQASSRASSASAAAGAGAAAAAASSATVPSSPARKLPPRPIPDPSPQERAVEDAIMHPGTIEFLSWRQLLGLLPRLSRRWNHFTMHEEAQAVALWRAACEGLRREAGLYVPPGAHTSHGVGAAAWKKMFFDQLWPARRKWAAAKLEDEALARSLSGDLSVDESDKDHTGFKIAVAVRFRPGPQADDKFSLPLHQFLKLKREEMRRARSGGGDASAAAEGSLGQVVGAEAPEEFKCPVTRAVMRDPVTLPSSGAVVDRATAEAHIRARGTDPFDGTPLSRDSLVSDDALRARISAWNAEQAADEKHRVTRDAVKSLVDAGSDLSPEILEALMEAERLQGLAKRAQIEAAESDRLHKWSHGKLGREEAMDLVVSRHGDAMAADGDDDVARVDGIIDSEFADLESGKGDTTGGDADGGATGEDAAFDGGAAAGAGAGAGKGDDIGPDFGRRRHTRDGARVLAARDNRVVMFVPGTGVRPFHFAQVHDAGTDQATMYERAARPTVTSALNGFNACFLCYGQTGSGKSHTVFGPEGADVTAAEELRVGRPLSSAGIVLRACAEVLQAAEDMARIPEEDGGAIRLTVTAQYVEIYNEAVTDLMTGRPVMVRQQTGTMHGVVETRVSSMDDVFKLLAVGHARKNFAATAMNERSSRAHTVFVLSLTHVRGDRMIKSHSHFVDLAGCERVKKSRVEGGRLLEAANINRSLMHLGQVIAALVEERSHVPYRDTALTILLRSAFGGSSRTTAVITARMDDDHADETLQALHFGERCGMVTNVAKFAASSVTEAMSSVDGAIAQVRSQMAGLEARGKTALPTYQRLRDRLAEMERKRAEIQESVSGGGGSGADADGADT